MTQLTDDCFAAGGPLMTIEAALALVMPRLDRVTEAEEVPLAEAAGRILLADVMSPLDLPEAGIPMRGGRPCGRTAAQPPGHLARGRAGPPEPDGIAALEGRPVLHGR